jgi:hypothetical protein
MKYIKQYETMNTSNLKIGDYVLITFGGKRPAKIIYIEDWTTNQFKLLILIDDDFKIEHVNQYYLSRKLTSDEIKDFEEKLSISKYNI